MKLKTIIWCISSLLLVAYLVAIFFWVGDAFRGSQCTGMEIYVADTATNHFVTIPEISREIDSLPSRCQGMLLRDINTDSIEKKLNSIDKIESASCVKLNNGMVIVSVNPMRPVARVFEKEVSYYINCEGKRISADARYFLDVPVISGQFDSVFTAVSLLPLIEYIKSDAMWSSLITMIKTDARHEIYLIPAIRGHVIKFGDMSNMENKFARLRRMYEEVLPVKGWDCYDTLAVKWNGQVVATKRAKKLAESKVKYDEEIENEAPDVGSMIADETTDTVSVKNSN